MKKYSRPIPLTKYVALNNTARARRLVSQYGIPPVESMPDLERKLAYIISEFKEEGLEQVMKIHPDLPLMVEFSDAGHAEPELNCNGSNGKKSGGCGCGCGKKEKELNFVTNYRTPDYFMAVGDNDVAGTVVFPPAEVYGNKNQSAGNTGNAVLVSVGVSSLLIGLVLALNASL